MSKASWIAHWSSWHVNHCKAVRLSWSVMGDNVTALGRSFRCFNRAPSRHLSINTHSHNSINSFANTTSTSVNMSSFQDKAQHHIANIDKEVRRSLQLTCSCAEDTETYLESTPSTIYFELTFGIASCPSTQLWTIWRSKPRSPRSTLSSGLSQPISSSSSSTSEDNFSPTSLDLWSQGTIPLRLCSLLERVMIHSGSQYAKLTPCNAD